MTLRVPKADLAPELTETMIEQLGAVPEPVEVMWHNPAVARAGLAFGATLSEWDAADESLKSFAHMAVERDVLEYAEAVTNTPPTVTDELSARLLDRLSPAALVELTAFIAFCNMSTRSNVALGIESQGFSAGCEIPLAAPAEAPAVASTS